YARQTAAEQFAAQRALQVRSQAAAGQARSARSTLTWGVLSALCVCSPIAAVIAFVSYSRSKEAARQAGVALPGSARAGFWLSLLGVVWFVGFWGYVIWSVQQDGERVEARKLELSQKLNKSDANRLDHESACELAELYLLTNGYDGNTQVAQFKDFECAGALKTEPSLAALEDLKFRTSSSGGLQTVAVCLKHGDRWFVDRVTHRTCDVDAVSGVASADGGKKPPPKRAAPAPNH
ncbi:MAG TPA: hypothetical protein VGM29_05885, partial [Polyangiaceae bacterium]